jgi:hypothetical protein
MQNLNDYVDRLVAEKGFNEKDPEVIAQLKADLLDRVETRIDAMIADTLPAEVLPEFETVLEQGNTEDVQDFVKKHIPDIDEKVASELLTFRTIYLS